MKITNSFRALLRTVAVLILCLAAAQGASAKYSKACTRFTYDGVKVNVIDRSREVGNPYDTYGYAEYTNHNDHSVVVKWKAYGVLKGSKKLVRVDGGAFKLRAGETRKQLYSYTAPNHSFKEIEKYVVAIEPQDLTAVNKASSKFTKDGVSVEVIDRHKLQGRGMTSYGYLDFKNGNDCRVKVKWSVYGVLNNGRSMKVDDGEVIIDANKTHKEVYQYGGNDDFDSYAAAITVTKLNTKAEDPGTDAVYSRIMSHKQQGSLTEQDYTDALNWMDYQLDHGVGPAIKSMWALADQNDEGGVDNMISKSEPLLERFKNIGDIIEDANNAGKLTAANKSKMQQIQKKIDAITN